MSRFAHAAILSAAILLAPTPAHAQATITGIVVDTSKTALSNVSVEVSSPALTDKVRTGTTDEQGQYRVGNLPPGIYTVVFTLRGYATLKREGLELSETLPTATLNAVLRVSGAAGTFRGPRIADLHVVLRSGSTASAP
jgi:Carboxypeptidase regulatory-like domain